MPPRIYMDANATTPLLPEVFDAMRPYFTEWCGNASSIHQAGQRARAAVDHARDQVARLLCCRASEIVFTSGGTESDNLALFGTLEPGQHLVTSAIEHHAVLHAGEALAKRGVEVTLLACDGDGLIQPAALAEALQPNTRLVSVMLANNETGVVQPVGALAALAKQHGALFHTDAVQGVGKLVMDLSLTCSASAPSGSLKDVDLLAISGHKMYAPQGTGVLFVRRNTRLAPMFHGGLHERQRRAGTENVPGIVALGKAAQMAATWLAGGGAEELAGLRDRLERELRTTIAGCGIHGVGVARTPNTTNVWFDGVDAEALVIALDLKGLAVSGGSACQSGATEPSHVLLAMGMSEARARSSIRISLSRATTPGEIDRAALLVGEAVAQLRAVAG